MASEQNERVPAEVFPPGEFIAEEMRVRGWTSQDVAARMGGDPLVDQLCVDLLVHVRDTSIILGERTANGLGRAFGVSPQYFLNLDRMWRAYGPPSRHATAH